VYLEIVSDLTKEAFIAILKRFVSRRGKPLHSNNGTNFIRDNNELTEFGNLFAQECKDQGETIEELEIS